MNKIIFWLKNKLLRHHSISVYKRLLKNESLCQEELDKLKLEKMRSLFSHAKANTEYYSKAFADFEVEDICSIDDWNKLPVLKREDIREHIDAMVANGVDKKYLGLTSTGGSTGVPLKSYHDKRFASESVSWRLLKWWGIDPSDNVGFIYRSKKTKFKSFLNALLWYPTKRSYLDASIMDENSMKEFFIKLRKSKARYLQGYVGGVYEFAKYCSKNDLEVKGLKAVWVTAAPLTEAQRGLMEKVFACPVYDQYGSCEVFWLAAECQERKGLHTFSDIRHLEMMKDDLSPSPVGEYGRVLVTDLENYAFPIIRYENGDRGRFLKEECPCGCAFPLIDKIKGRVTDLVKTPSGSIISGEFLTTIFDDFPDVVKEFQVVQNKDYSIDLICIAEEVPEAMKICQGKSKDLQDLMKNEIPVRVVFVESINHDRGKTRFVISNI